jgi:hypothetical protein
MSDVKTTLENLGYSLTRDGMNYFRAPAIYRDGDNPSALRINSKTGRFIDFVSNTSGSIYDLVQLTLGFKNFDEAKSWLENHEFNLGYSKSEASPLIEDSIKTYPNELLDKLFPVHDYWVKRGVSENTLKQYNSGVAVSGSMANRYVFPIIDFNCRIIGFAGRDLTGEKVKWKLVGAKKNWFFPYKNHVYIKEKREVIFVESIGDCLALEEAGIKTSIVLFGTYLNDNTLSRIVGLDPKKVIIGLNNDSNNNNVGQENAKKIEERLLNFFDGHRVKIAIPQGAKDFGEMSKEQILDWYAKTK